MTDQVAQSAAPASPAASPDTSAPATTTESPSPAPSVESKPVDRAPDGKFAKRGNAPIWKTKPDPFASERAEAAPAAPPVPEQTTSAPVPAAPKPPKTDNFVPQPRFDQVIAERTKYQRELQAAQQELAALRAEAQRYRAAPPPQQQQETLPRDIADYFGIPADQVPPPQVQQLFQQVTQQQQVLQQMQHQQAVDQARVQLNHEAGQAYSSLVSQGVPAEIAKAAVANAMPLVSQNDQLQVIDAAAMWLERNRQVLAFPQQAAPAPRQAPQAPPLPTSAPAGSPNAPVRPAYNAPYNERIKHLTALLGR